MNKTLLCVFLFCSLSCRKSLDMSDASYALFNARQLCSLIYTYASDTGYSPERLDDLEKFANERYGDKNISKIFYSDRDGLFKWVYFGRKNISQELTNGNLVYLFRSSKSYSGKGYLWIDVTSKAHWGDVPESTAPKEQPSGPGPGNDPGTDKPSSPE